MDLGLGDSAGNGDTNSAGLEVGEALLAKLAEEYIGRAAQVEVGIAHGDSLFELANSTSRPVAHIVQIRIKDGQLDVATGLENAPCLGDDVAVVALRGSCGEAEDNSGKEV